MSNIYLIDGKIDGLKSQIDQIATEKVKLEETIKSLLLNREIAKTFNAEERTNPQENNSNYTSQRSDHMVEQTVKRENREEKIISTQAPQNQISTPTRKNTKEFFSEQKKKLENSAKKSPKENKPKIETPTKNYNKVLSKAFPNKKTNNIKKNEAFQVRASTPSPKTKSKNTSSYSELAQKAKLMMTSKTPILKDQKKKVPQAKETLTNSQKIIPHKNISNNFQRELVLLSPERSEVSPKELSPTSLQLVPDCWTSQNRVSHNSQIFNVSRLTPVRLFQSPFDENINTVERGRGFESTNKPVKNLDFDGTEIDGTLLNNVSPNVIEVINQFQNYRRSKSNPRSMPSSNYNSRERPSVPSTINGNGTNKFNGVDLWSTYNSKGGKENKKIDFEFIKELGLEQGFSTRTGQDSGKAVESNRIGFKTNESQMQENSNIIDFIEKEKMCIDSTKLSLEERIEFGVLYYSLIDLLRFLDTKNKPFKRSQRSPE